MGAPGKAPSDLGLNIGGPPIGGSPWCQHGARLPCWLVTHMLGGIGIVTQGRRDLRVVGRVRIGSLRVIVRDLGGSRVRTAEW
jgi:hypothetical protein